MMVYFSPPKTDFVKYADGGYAMITGGAGGIGKSFADQFGKLGIYLSLVDFNEPLLTLIREFLGPSASAFSGKKSRIIAGDVTVGTSKMKIICADTVSVGHSYDANLKWHMPTCAEICRAEQKYMPFFGTITERAFRKKNPKHKNIYK